MSGVNLCQRCGNRSLARMQFLCCFFIIACLVAMAGCNLQQQSSENSSQPMTGGMLMQASLPQATLGERYSTVLLVAGGRPPYRFTVSGGQLPAGLAIELGTGSISGIPTAMGEFEFTVSLADSMSSIPERHSYNLWVHPPNHSVTVEVSPINPSVARGATLEFSALVRNTSNTAVTWSTSAGSITSGGLLSTPTTPSLNTITVTAKSVAQPWAQASTLVFLTNAGPTITTSSLPSGTVGVVYNASLTASGGTLPYVWNVTSGSLPNGVQLGSSSGTVSGTPSQTGAFTFGVRVTDAAGQTAQGTLSILVSASTACGPPIYCSRTDLSIMQLPSSLPNVGKLTGANSIVTDPDFNDRIVRITDWNTDPSLAGTDRDFISTASGSADDNIWNLNSTLFIIQNVTGGAYPFSFNPSTMQAARMYSSNYPSTGGLKLPDGGNWSRAEANVLYVSSGTQITKYDMTDPTNPPVAQLVFDFTSSTHCLPAGFNVTWSARAGVSAGDTVFGMAFSNNGGQGTGVYAVAYKPGSGCTMLNTRTGQVTGDWGANATITLNDRWLIHNAKLSKDGNWLIIASAGCLSATCSKAPYFWQIGTTNVSSCGAGGHCGGHWTEGYTHWQNNDNSPIGNQVMRLMDEATSAVTLTPTLPHGLVAPLDQHQSWNNADPADSAPFLSTTESSLTNFPAPWYNEIIAVATDGSGKVWRFAHNFITNRSQTFSTKHAIGSVSQDGRFFLFSSDWMGTLGSELGTQSCTIGQNCRGDTFVVELK